MGFPFLHLSTYLVIAIYSMFRWATACKDVYPTHGGNLPGHMKLGLEDGLTRRCRWTRTCITNRQVTEVQAMVNIQHILKEGLQTGLLGHRRIGLPKKRTEILQPITGMGDQSGTIEVIRRAGFNHKIKVDVEGNIPRLIMVLQVVKWTEITISGKLHSHFTIMDFLQN